MKLLFIIKNEAEHPNTNATGQSPIELHIYARTEKEAIAKALNIAPRDNYYVDRVFQQEEEPLNTGVFERLVDAVEHIEFQHNDL